LFSRREIQILIENIFGAMNFKNIKDDYSEKFVEISGKYKVELPILTIHRQTI
jgi:hypothetical protein